jgi:integrase/recombinase XerD
MNKIKQQLDSYMADCILRKLSPRTIETYERAIIKKLNAYCAKHKIEDLQFFTTANLTELLMESANFSSSSLSRLQSIVCCIIKYLNDMEIINHRGLRQRNIKIENKRPVFYDQREINIIKEAIKHKPTRIFVELILQTGLRFSEAINLKKADVNWNTGTMVIRETKGNVDRVVFVDKKLLQELQLMAMKNSEFVLPCHYNTYKLNLSKISKQLGIRVFSHAFRHTFATRFDREMHDPSALQIILGHKSLSTTQRYTHLNAIDIQTALGKYQKILRKKGDVKYVSTDKV